MECDDEGLFLRLCRGVNIQGNPKWTSNGRILWTGQDYYYYKNNVYRGVEKFEAVGVLRNRWRLMLQPLDIRFLILYDKGTL